MLRFQIKSWRLGKAIVSSLKYLVRLNYHYIILIYMAILTLNIYLA
jgi:hypothetical protein